MGTGRLWRALEGTDGPGGRQLVWEGSDGLTSTAEHCRLLVNVASRPRFGGDSQALSWYRPAEMRPSRVGTNWKSSAGRGPAIPKGFSYVYKYQVVSQVE